MLKAEDVFLRLMHEKKAGNLGLAMVLLNDFLLEQPTQAWAWSERGAILDQLGNPFDAVMNYDRAVGIAPKTASFYNNRGVAFLGMSRFDQAIADFKRAVHHDPNLAAPQNSLGVSYRRMGDPLKAIEHYREAIRLDPNYAEAHLGLSFSLLETERYAEGWHEFEWRWKTGQMPVRGLKYPVWEGKQAGNKNDGLLIYGEQGFGDNLQFIRYAHAASKLWGGKTYVEVKQPLTRLAKTLCPSVDGIVTLGEPIPENVTHCVAMMSVPRYVEGYLASEPYLFADGYRSGIWAERLKALPPGYLVGLCWAGMSRVHDPMLDAIDRARSMKLADFASFAQPGVSWVSLQCGPSSVQVKTPPRGMTILDPSDDLHDFYDTAALIDNLDLVITVDTAVAHVAGALGKPVWMLSRFDGCWRWLGRRNDSPWYPSLTQFRQRELGKWEPVIAEVACELTKLVQTQSKVVRRAVYGASDYAVTA